MKFFTDILGDMRARVPLIKIAAAVKIFALLYALYAITAVVLAGVQIAQMPEMIKVEKAADFFGIATILAKPVLIYIAGFIGIFAFAEILKVFAHFDSYVNRKNKIHNNGNMRYNNNNNRNSGQFVNKR